MIFSRADWQEKAACKGVSSDIMFPDNPGGQDSVYIPALSYCRNCPVTQQCLDYALDFESGQRCRYGVFGGKTPKERYLLEDAPSPVRIKR